MEATRKIVNSNDLASIMEIPKSLRNRQVELIVLPIAGSVGVSVGKKPKSAYGILKKYANTDLIESENSAWADAAKEKYALR